VRGPEDTGLRSVRDPQSRSHAVAVHPEADSRDPTLSVARALSVVWPGTESPGTGGVPLMAGRTVSRCTPGDGDGWTGTLRSRNPVERERKSRHRQCAPGWDRPRGSRRQRRWRNQATGGPGPVHGQIQRQGLTSPRNGPGGAARTAPLPVRHFPLVDQVSLPPELLPAGWCLGCRRRRSPLR
jgi:hypothetical protein